MSIRCVANNVSIRVFSLYNFIKSLSLVRVIHLIVYFMAFLWIEFCSLKYNRGCNTALVTFCRIYKIMLTFKKGI